MRPAAARRSGGESGTDHDIVGNCGPAVYGKPKRCAIVSPNRPSGYDYLLTEKLAGKLECFHSIRVNKQWRRLFEWDGGRGEATGVYLDDHSYR
jgi:hypothetical protein